MIAKRDHPLTKVWVSIVMIMTSAASLHAVYLDWTLSISGFSVGASDIPGRVNGDSVVLYSVVVL